MSVFAGIPVRASKGETTAFERTFQTTDYVFQVTQVWKGPIADTLTVRTYPSGGMCGYQFKLGDYYLVYADERKGDLWTGICNRTNPMELALWEQYSFPTPEFRRDAQEFPRVSLADLFAGLAAEDPRIRHAAAVALADIDDRRDSILLRLRAALRGEVPSDPRAAMRCLSKMEGNAISALPELGSILENGDTDSRSEAIWTLASILRQDPSRFFSFLVMGLADQNASVLEAALGRIHVSSRGLTDDQRQDLLSRISELLNHPNAHVRFAAVNSLDYFQGDLGEFLPSLEYLRQFDPDLRVRSRAETMASKIAQSSD